MWDALIAAIMAAVTAKASEDIGRGAQFAWTSLLGKLTSRLGPKAELIDARDPAALETALQEILGEDPAFAARLQAMALQAELPLEAVTVPRTEVPVRRTVWALPAGVPDFVNQLAALARLEEVRAAGTPAIVVLTGPPGAGKTATALHYAHRHRASFGGGQLLGDFRERALAGPAPADAVLSGMVRAMQPGGVLPDSFDERVAAYRTLTSHDPMTVVLLNVSEPAQVRPFVPTAPGSILLVCTQRDVRGLTMDSAQFVEVAPLDDEAARALLIGVCGAGRIDADPVATVRLIELAGRLPLALRILAGRLLHDGTLTIGELAGELAGEPHLLEALAVPGDDTAAVRPLITNVCRHLPADGLLLHRDLGALPVARPSDALLARIGWTDRTRLRAAVEQLIGLHLLGRGTVCGTYAVHPLVRAHGAQLAGETDPARVERITAEALAHVVAYAESADQAIMGDRHRLIRPPAQPDGPFAGPGRRAEALRALEDISEDLLTLAEAGLALQAYERVARLATAAQALYFNHPHLADFTMMTDRGIEAARALGRPDVEVQMHCALVSQLLAAGEPARAHRAIRTASALLPKVADQRVAGTYWEFRGRVLDAMARNAEEGAQAALRAEAAEAFERSIAIWRDAGGDRGVAISGYYFGVFLDAAGRTDEALERLAQARDGLYAVGDDRNATRAEAAIGAVHLRTGAFRRAYDEIAAAAGWFAAAELWRYELRAREQLIQAASALGDQAAAAEHTARAAEIRGWSDLGN